MFSPQAIGYLLAIETAYAISLAFGVGELATGLLLVAGVVFVGEQVLVLIEELVAFVEAASGARTSADLDQAAKHMATALTLGLDIVVALLLRRRGRKAQGPEVVVRAKSGGAGGRRRTPKYQMEEPSPAGKTGKKGKEPYEQPVKHQAPDVLPKFPKAKQKRTKNGRKRWEDDKGNIYEWDSQHGKVEVYGPGGKKGSHKGEFDPNTGEQTKPANPTREAGQ